MHAGTCGDSLVGSLRSVVSRSMQKYNKACGARFPGALRPAENRPQGASPIAAATLIPRFIRQVRSRFIFYGASRAISADCDVDSSRWIYDGKGTFRVSM